MERMEHNGGPGRRNGFAEFLVARRAELRPADVGLPGGGRRRTPGLRREEVAILAGVSADYLARLEQGRDTNPSVAVVDALADALLLRGAPRHHLTMLALTSGNEYKCPGAESPQEEVADSLLTVLRALHPMPAFVTGRYLNVLDWNPAWADFVAPLGLLDGNSRPNLAWYVFMNPTARRVLPDWGAAADGFAAALNRAKIRWPADESLRDLIEGLRAEPEFEDRWKSHHIGAEGAGVLTFEHPDHGLVRVPYETLDTDRDQSVVIWMTDRTAAQAPGLRLVTRPAANE
ncbi:helix-turn-helix transcriptional regulator [Nocardia takedensis]|uniref:helix-turn-helix transcriptional regulator n=1 Tax=Nocardia takedensis TaxID=259390 RepID=UPI001FDF5F28|nr:helix-turn-helix transcriptional regulator [Nocardia takedensis]